MNNQSREEFDPVQNHMEQIDLLEEKISALKEENYELKESIKNKNEEFDIDSCKDIADFYDTLVNYYYHGDFSFQEMFKRIGKKTVEEEMFMFLNNNQ